jgi:hypothetical protein
MKKGESEKKRKITYHEKESAPVAVVVSWLVMQWQLQWGS